MVLYNSFDPNYKQPFGALECGGNLSITFPVHHSIRAQAVYIVIRGEQALRLPLLKVKSQKDYDFFHISFTLDKEGLYFYRFEIDFKEGIRFVGRGERGKAKIGDWLPEWQQAVYKQGFATPDFIKGGIVYHIFVDRFARTEGAAFCKQGVFKCWNEDVSTSDRDGKYRANDFYGGNLKGIIGKLDYLASLNVSLIYLSPIFKAYSNHRYDTGDYFTIDELIGSEQDFSELIAQAKQYGIGIMLDGVFNHTGSDSIYFNKYGNYDSIGAWQGKQSPYYNWYTFLDEKKGYLSWWGIKNVPSIRRDALGFQEMIAGSAGVLEKWTSFGVAGWRLDVADELSLDFIKKIRDKLKSLNQQTLLLGEVWEDASNKISYGEQRQYFNGNLLDGVMNYPFRELILQLIKDKDIGKFIEGVEAIIENYPKQALDTCLVMLSSHDTVRAINELSGASCTGLSKREKKLRNLTLTEYSKGKKRLKLASFLQYFLPGVPSIYYGDEVGMQGWDDPINRRPFTANPDKELLAHYIELGKLRAKYKPHFTSLIKLTSKKGCLFLQRGGLTGIVNLSGATLSLQELLSTNNITDELTGKVIALLDDMQFTVLKNIF